MFILSVWLSLLLSFFLFCFLKFLADTYPFFGATGTLVLDFWWRLLWVSKPEWVLPCGGKCNVHSPRSTSGSTHADLLAAGMQPVTSPHACAEVGLGSDSNGQSLGQNTKALPLCQRPGFFIVKVIFYLNLWNYFVQRHTHTLVHDFFGVYDIFSPFSVVI